MSASIYERCPLKGGNFIGVLAGPKNAVREGKVSYKNTKFVKIKYHVYTVL